MFQMIILVKDIIWPWRGKTKMERPPLSELPEWEIRMLGELNLETKHDRMLRYIRSADKYPEHEK